MTSMKSTLSFLLVAVLTVVSLQAAEADADDIFRKHPLPPIFQIPPPSPPIFHWNPPPPNHFSHPPPPPIFKNPPPSPPIFHSSPPPPNHFSHPPPSPPIFHWNPPPPNHFSHPPPPPIFKNPPPSPPIFPTHPPPPKVNSSPPPTPSPPPVDCKKHGGICGDPRIIGGDGVMFYFHGRKNQDFCLVSDSDLHINAHFIGKRPEGRQRDFTWVQALGFITGGHSLSVIAKHVANWESSVDQLEFSCDGKPFEIPTGERSSWTSPDDKMTLERLGATNSVDLRIKEKMGVSLNVVPIGKRENEVHRYGITADDCFAHFDMQFRFYNLSSSVNGVLGQTYQPGFVNPVRRDVAMPIMGHAERFFSSSLLATDCQKSQYTATAIVAGSAMPRFNVLCESSGRDGIPGGLTCRR